MAVYPNNRYASASPYRQIGGAAPGFDALQSAASRGRNRFTNAAWSAVSGGDRATGLLPGIPGALAAYHSNSASLVVSNATLFAGRFIEGVSSPALSTSPAPLQLRALCAGNATVTLTVPAAPVAQLVPLTGTTTAGCTVAISQLRATATLTILPAPILLTLAAELSATGWLSGTISPYSPLSPESLAAKVEETLGPRLDNIEQKVGITLALAAAR
jgi:hypothetical protein